VNWSAHTQSIAKESCVNGREKTAGIVMHSAIPRIVR
jgi:hypothetical protein